MINVVVFALLTLIFGAAGIYFGFFVCPDFFAVAHFTNQFSGVGIQQAGYFSEFSFVFPAAIAVLGLAVGAASVIGLVLSVKSMLDERNDELVVKSFLQYVAVAYIVAIFFVANALVFYNVYGKGVTAWWIVICIIVAIAALIGGNVPMMKLLEDKDQNNLTAIIFNVMGVVGCAVCAVLVLPAVAALTSQSVVYNLPLKLGTAAVTALIVAVLGLASGAMVKKGIKNGTSVSGATIIGAVGLLFVGLFFTGAGTYNALYNSNHNSYDKIWKNNWDLVLTKGTGISGNNKIPTDFVVMSYIAGIALIAIAVAFIVYTVIGKKKASATTK